MSCADTYQSALRTREAFILNVTNSLTKSSRSIPSRIASRTLRRAAGRRRLSSIPSERHARKSMLLWRILQLLWSPRKQERRQGKHALHQGYRRNQVVVVKDLSTGRCDARSAMHTHTPWQGAVAVWLQRLYIDQNSTAMPRACRLPFLCRTPLCAPLDSRQLSTHRTRQTTMTAMGRNFSVIHEKIVHYRLVCMCPTMDLVASLHADGQLSVHRCELTLAENAA